MLFGVNGLFGWIETNDQRSLALFAGFLAAFHLAAALALYFPLAAFDPAHAPVFAWGGYVRRYVPLATLAAIAVFAAQMLWHVKSVRRTVAFEFVDDGDEPRLCRIVERLSIGMGLPAPYVGVVESAAMNAFACGLRREDAVVVMTRGLIDGLDDDELAAVIAHELAHIANGDIRLMAATNVCLNMLDFILKPRRNDQTRLMQIASLPMLTIFMPPVLLFVLIMGVLGHAALQCGRLVRLLISTSREFVADAASVEATQNPAALVSALSRIEGRSRIENMPAGQDAMMIDGDVEGSLATHPSISERIRAIIAVTGSMALNAPSRRDTRPIPQRAFGRRNGPTSAPLPPVGAIARVAAVGDRNWLGLTRDMTLSAALAVAAFVAMNARDLGHPEKLMTALDPRPFNAFILVAGRGSACNFFAMGKLASGRPLPEMCAPGAMNALIAQQNNVPGPVGDLFRAMPADFGGTFKRTSTKPN